MSRKPRRKPNAVAAKRQSMQYREPERQRKDPGRATRELIYRFSILDFTWFMDDLPDHPAVPFTLLINPSLPLALFLQLPEKLNSLGDLSESQLRFICKQLKTPEWVTRPDVGRSRMTWSDTRLLIGLDRPTDAFMQRKLDQH